jgi:hypothetical protein
VTGPGGEKSVTQVLEQVGPEPARVHTRLGSICHLDQGPPGVLIGEGVDQVDHHRRLVLNAAGGGHLVQG